MSAIAHRPHRVTSAITDARASLSSVAEVAVWSMDAAETTTAIAEVTKAESQLAELEARLLAHADRADLRGENGSTSTANWHAVATTTTRAAAHRAGQVVALEGLRDPHCAMGGGAGGGGRDGVPVRGRGQAVLAAEVGPVRVRQQPRFELDEL